MPPKQDLRGGKASVDSLAMSSNILVASMNRTFLTGGCQRIEKEGNEVCCVSYRSFALVIHQPMGVVSDAEKP